MVKKVNMYHRLSLWWRELCLPDYQSSYKSWNGRYHQESDESAQGEEELAVANVEWGAEQAGQEEDAFSYLNTLDLYTAAFTPVCGRIFEFDQKRKVWRAWKYAF